MLVSGDSLNDFSLSLLSSPRSHQRSQGFRDPDGT
jgi:hypothetical protein